MRRANTLHGFEFASTFCDLCKANIPLADRRHHCFECNIDRCICCCERNSDQRHPEDHVGSWYPGVAPLGDTARAVAVHRMLREHDQVLRDLRGRPMGTFADTMRAILNRELPNGLTPEAALVAERSFDVLLTLSAMGRFVDFFARKSLSGTSVEFATDLMSSGVRDANRWRGIPLFKTVFDCALYPILLGNIRPATIVELGSALGGSAVWFRDLSRMLRFDCHVYSMDLIPPDIREEGVTFLEGNSHRVDKAFPPAFLKQAPHPWIVIEDAHVNIGGVLDYFSTYMWSGDYVVIEDTDAEAALGKYLVKHPDSYSVDTYYTDYFGYNATCSRDQILCFQRESSPATSGKRSS